MMKSTRTALVSYLSFFVVLALPACDADTVTPDDGAAALEPSATMLISRPADIDIEQENAENMAVLINQYGARMNAISKEAQSWQDADTNVRFELENSSTELPSYYQTQIAGRLMLAEWLLDAEPTEEVQDAMVFYTKRMIESGSPEASLIHSALQSLEGHLAPEVIGTLAQSASTSATARLQKMLDCEQCGLQRLSEQLPTEARSSAEGHAYTILEAVEELGRLADDHS